jgi:hypothetical protein
MWDTHSFFHLKWSSTLHCINWVLNTWIVWTLFPIYINLSFSSKMLLTSKEIRRSRFYFKLYCLNRDFNVVNRVTFHEWGMKLGELSNIDDQINFVRFIARYLITENCIVLRPTKFRALFMFYHDILLNDIFLVWTNCKPLWSIQILINWFVFTLSC